MLRTVVARSWLTIMVVALAPVPRALGDSFVTSSSGTFKPQISIAALDDGSARDAGTPGPVILGYMTNEEGYFLMLGPGIARPMGGASAGMGGSAGTYLLRTYPTGPGVVNGNGENGLVHQLMAGADGRAYGLYGKDGFDAKSSGPALPVFSPMFPTMSSPMSTSRGGSALNETVTIVNPEPGTIILFCTGLLGIGLWRYRRQNQ